MYATSTMRSRLDTAGAFVVVGWLLATVLASPMAVFTSVGQHQVNGNATVCSVGASTNERIAQSKLAYGLFTLVIQYCLPTTITVYAYARICLRLRRRRRRGLGGTENVKSRQTHTIFDDIVLTETCRKYQSQPRNQDMQRRADYGDVTANQNVRCTLTDSRQCGAQHWKSQDDNVVDKLELSTVNEYSNKIKGKKDTRINALLAIVTLTFVITWLPWNIVNLLLDIKEISELEYLKSLHQNENIIPWETVYISNHTPSRQSMLSKNTLFTGREYILIHCFSLLCILFATCINPILYGWLNKNFRREFKYIISHLKYISKLFVCTFHYS